MADNTRIATIVRILKKTYPDAHIFLRYSTPWELLVAVILSAQCTDIRVNIVTAKLFKKYPSVADYLQADSAAFEKDIKPTGFYHDKAKHILAAAQFTKGRIPKTMEEMLRIPGVGRKTANVVLGNAYGVVAGIAVDTHVLRISQRLRLVDLTKIGGRKLMVFERTGKIFIDYTKDADPVKVEKELMDVISKKDWFVLTYLLINHGRTACRARNPACAVCPLTALCPSSRLRA